MSDKLKLCPTCLERQKAAQLEFKLGFVMCPACTEASISIEEDQEIPGRFHVSLPVDEGMRYVPPLAQAKFEYTFRSHPEHPADAFIDGSATKSGKTEQVSKVLYLTRAEPTGDEAVPDLHFSVIARRNANETFGETRARHDSEASELADWLSKCLPGGMLDRLRVKLLAQACSDLVVVQPLPEPELQIPAFSPGIARRLAFQHREFARRGGITPPTDWFESSAAQLEAGALAFGELMHYIDVAKAEAGKGGRVSGEPLDLFIKRREEEFDQRDKELNEKIESLERQIRNSGCDYCTPTSEGR